MGLPIPLDEKVNMAAEIASGMAHLASLHFIHRDLAARNVLLSHGKSEYGVVCKVADFGLSRGSGAADNAAEDGGPVSQSEDYYKSTKGVFPVRWTAPESMETLRFTQASDVWSFGIVCVEILQDGRIPYPALVSNPDVMRLTLSGGKHEQPRGCSDEVYGILLQCWSTEANDRPTFEALSQSFAAVHDSLVAGESANPVGTGRGSRTSVIGAERSHAAPSNAALGSGVATTNQYEYSDPTASLSSGAVVSVATTTNQYEYSDPIASLRPGAATGGTDNAVSQTGFYSAIANGGPDNLSSTDGDFGFGEAEESDDLDGSGTRDTNNYVKVEALHKE
jgi:serine/threonine protein kinase